MNILVKRDGDVEIVRVSKIVDTSRGARTLARIYSPEGVDLGELELNKDDVRLLPEQR